jgi:hypothetical protein
LGTQVYRVREVVLLPGAGEVLVYLVSVGEVLQEKELEV